MKNTIPLFIDNMLTQKITTLVLLSIVLMLPVQANTVIDQIVAVVENDVITETELVERINVLRAQAGADAQLPDSDVLAAQVLERMILERLQIDWGQRRGIQVDDLSLDQAMRNLAARNNMDLNGFRNVLLKQGIDYVSFREQIRTEMIINQVRRRAIDANIKISENEIDALLESQKNQLDNDLEYRLSHILIQLPQNPTPTDIATAREAIEALHERANTGESFTQLAIAHSQAQDALEGGDLGWRSSEQLPNVFSKELAGMQTGDISNILRSSSGFHIFRIIDTRGDQVMLVEQVLARHILIRPNAVRSKQEVITDLNNLRARILNGDDFGELAKAHSEDPGSSVNGGSLGWSTPSVYAPAFRDQIERLALNTLSEPFETQFGWHVLEVLDTRQHDNSLEARRNQVRDYLRQRKIEEETELWQRQLRDESYVENRVFSDDS